MGKWSDLLKQLEENPKAKASMEKALGNELPMLNKGTGAIELPGNTGLVENNLAEHPYAAPQPGRAMLSEGRGTPIELPGNIGIEETGAMGRGTPAQELPMLNPGRGNSTPIELPGAQLEETGAMGQGTPTQELPVSESSLGESVPDKTSSSISSEAEASNPSMVQDHGNLGDTLRDPPVETPEAMQYSGDPVASDLANSDQMSLKTKAALGLGGLGLGAGMYSMTGNTPPPTAAPPMPPPERTPASDDQGHLDPSKFADIGGRGGAPHQGPTHPRITPGVTDKHLQDALQFGNSAEQAAALQEVKNRQSMAELAAGLGQAGNIIGNSWARVPVNAAATAQNAELLKQAQNITPEYLANQEHDPNSSQSLALRNVLDKLGVKYSGEPTAAQLKTALPYIFKDQEAKQAQQARSEDQKYRYDLMAQNRLLAGQAHKDALAAAQADKFNKQRTADLFKIEQMAMSARSMPEIVQAERDQYAAQKANKLATQYGDPNNLSNPQVHMLVGEVAKIATGGVPAMAELKDLSPDTLRGELAGAWSKLANSATPAHAAEFIQQYQQYANNIGKDAQRVINEHYGRIFGPASTRYAGDPYFEAMKSGYMHRFDNHQFPTTNNGSTTNLGVPHAVQQGAAAEMAKRASQQAPPPGGALQPPTDDGSQ